MNVALALAVVAALLVQDDVARQIERIKSDKVEEREAATQALEEIGVRALPALEREARATSDLETRLRLQALLKSIPRQAQLAKVFGPTKRVTYAARGTPLHEVLDALGRALEEKIRLEGPDPAAPVTLDLHETPMWAALDAVAQAAQISYEYRKDGVVFLKGQAPWFPVRYSGQFRISVVEVKRVEVRRPGESASVVMIVPEVQYQRNVNPADKYPGGLSNLFEIETIADPQGQDLRSRPPWGPGSVSSRRPFGLQQFFYAKADSKTVTLQGVAKARFSRRDEEVTLPIAGEVREATLGEAKFSLEGFTPGASRTTVTLKGIVPDAPEAPDPPNRVKKIWLLGPSGQRVEGQGDRGTHSRTSFTETYEFPPLEFQPEKFAFLWVSEVFTLDLPFRLEGIPVPQP
jgi:hypothetical protein